RSSSIEIAEAEPAASRAPGDGHCAQPLRRSFHFNNDCVPSATARGKLRADGQVSKSANGDRHRIDVSGPDLKRTLGIRADGGTGDLDRRAFDSRAGWVLHD